mmetsp:Transcript_28073/g.63545  ORF Transcript_28073/g.63545 Transcript_28073/m.63545 type:complete len:409 (-) Transcript_28073:78-1304(-)
MLICFQQPPAPVESFRPVRTRERRRSLLGSSAKACSICASLSEVQDAPASPLINAGLSDLLLVQQTWIVEHAPNLRDVTVGPLVHSSNGRAATRTISARLGGQEQVLSSSVNYNMPTISSERKLMADRNRRKEEAAILALDSDAAVERRVKRARLQQGLREQRQDVDEDKVLRSMLEALVSQVERRADAERRRKEQSQRLCLPGRAAALHVGDLAYIRHPDLPLAVLRRVHRSGAKVDVQLCHLSPPEMGDTAGFRGVDRILLDSTIHGMDTALVIAPVAPLVPANTRNLEVYPNVRELWSTRQLWEAAKLAETHLNKAHAQTWLSLRTRDQCDCPACGPADANGYSMRRHLPECPFDAQRVPLVSELAAAALPTFLQLNSALWKRCIRAFGPEEIERIAEREHMLRV